VLLSIWLDSNITLFYWFDFALILSGKKKNTREYDPYVSHPYNSPQCMDTASLPMKAFLLKVEPDYSISTAYIFP